MTEELIRNYTEILKDELVPAMGCTEPIAIAYAAAKAAEVLGAEPEKINVACSGNIIKNVKGVTVPNSGGQKGIETAAVLGAVGGNADKVLEVIAGADDAAREKTRQMVAEGRCDVTLAENVPNLYIRAELSAGGHTASVVIEEHHTSITRIEKDGEVLFSGTPSGDRKEEARDFNTDGADGNTLNAGAEDERKGDLKKMTLRGIIEYANCVDVKDVEELLERQIRFNTAISQEGLDNRWGARVGKTILENWGSDVKARACARAAAGSDARMSGCPLPVIINSGSGNQGITVTMPVVTYAEQLQLSREKLYRCLCVSNLVSIYIKHFIGSLSAFCGAVSAACGAGAAITYMGGGSYEEIGGTITNTLGNVGGIVCDGAKPSCAAKIASSVHAALMGHYMSISNKEFLGGEGFVKNDVEETIKNMGYIGKIGMRETDKEILNVMIDKVDVESCL
ncbi:MAG: serine dehydratase subunit alpha family protein [Stomatobaculum sp.]|nr:serine dehydratase subunit alpha family protein [Stomatobaculum sp.]